MTQPYNLPTKQHFLVLLLLFALFNIFLLNFSMDQTHKFSETIVQNYEVSETTVPSVTRIVNDEVSETTIRPNIQIENEVTKNFTQSWLDYSKNWDGKILVTKHPNKAIVTLTDNYRMKMQSKGLHPLNLQHKRLRDRMERIDEYCSISPSGNNKDFQIIGFYSMLFHDESQLLQCLVPKAGSSSWVHVFSELVGLEIRRPLDPKDILWRTISLISNMKDNKLTAQRFQTTIPKVVVCLQK